MTSGSVTIKYSNGQNLGNVQEDATLGATGQFTAQDSRSGASYTWSVLNNGAGTYGTLSINSAGKWTYTLNNSAANVQALAAGEHVTDTLTVKVVDQWGHTDTQTVVVTINGSNDAPVITGVTTGNVQEDVTMTAGGQLSVTDVDHGASVSAASVSNMTQTYGSFSINYNTGAWTYTLNNSSSAVQSLAAGQVVHDSFVASVTDDKGATTTQTITVNITGSNDAPVISGATTGSVKEDTTLTTTGQLTATDVDHGATQSWSVMNDGHGTYGNLSIDQTGKWTYTLNNSAANVQALAQNQHVTDTFTVQVSDGQGGITTKSVAVDVTGTGETVVPGSTMTFQFNVSGTNDSLIPPVTLTATELANGQIRIDLVETGNVIGDLRGLFFQVSNETLLNGLKITGANVTSVQTSANGVSDLGNGDNVNGVSTGPFDVGVAFGTSGIGQDDIRTTSIILSNTSQPLTLDWLQSQDFALRLTSVGTDGGSRSASAKLIATSPDTITTPSIVITGNDSGSAKEDVTLTTTGQLIATDPTGATDVWSVVNGGHGTYGDLTVDVTGKWTYTLNNSASNVQSLAQGQTVTETFTVQAQDNSLPNATHTVTITITGTDDAPVVTSAIPDQAVALNTPFTLNAASHFADIDNGDHLTYSATLANGSPLPSWLSIDPNTGVVSGTPPANFGGAPATLGTITFQSESSAYHNTLGAYTVDASGHITGVQLVFADGTTQTAGSTGTFTTPAGQTIGLFIIADGYTQNNGYANLDLVNGHLEFRNADGTAATVNSSAPQLWYVAANGQATQLSGTVYHQLANGSTDLNLNADHLDHVHETTAADGTVTYGFEDLPNLGDADFNDTVVSVKTQTVADLGIKVTATDTAGASASDTFNLDLTNPVLLTANADTSSGTENQTLTINVLANDSDSYPGAVMTLASVSVPNGQGSVSIVNNQLVFNPGSAFDHLAQGATATVVATYTVQDQFGATATSTATITITGTNDAPVITGVATGNAQEDTTLSATGQLTSTDVDDGATATWSVASGTGTYGALSVDQTGKWTYSLNNSAANVQALAQGETVTDTFTVKVTDDKGAVTTQTVTVNVLGTNDAPVISGTTTGTAQEDITTTVTGQLTSTDVDHGATAAWSVVNGAGTYGALSIDQTGKWTYTLNNGATNVQALASGEHVTDTFTVKVTDDKGAITNQTVTVTINGINDAPVITSSAGQGSVAEDGTLTTSGTMSATDVDHNTTLTWSMLNGTGTYGTMTVDQTGQWVYTLNNSAANVQALALGQQVTDTLTVKVTDEHGASTTQTVTVYIQGANDAPVISYTTGQNIGSVTEDGTQTATGQFSSTDVDNGATATWTVTNGGWGTYGNLSVDATGKWTYTLRNNDNNVQALTSSQHVTDSFTVRVMDQNGAYADQTVTVTVNGTDDAPVITGTATGIAQEDTTLTTTGQLTGTDTNPNLSTWWTIDNNNGAYGSLSIDSTGKWTYTLNNSAANVQSLAAGEHVTDTFTVRLNDSGNASTTQTVTVTINGTNDAPVISGTATGTTQEDVTTTATGQLTSTDVDHGATATWSVDNGAGTYGSLTVDQTGKWTYTLNNSAANVQALAQGETATETFTVKVTDDKGAVTNQTVTVTVNGTNDAAVITGTSTGTVQEDATTTATGQLTSTDVDHGATATWGVVNVTGTYGSLTVDQTGQWTYTLNNSAANVQSLAQGEQVTDTFVVKVIDDKGAITNQTVTVTVNGTNDAPVVSGIATGTVQEDTTTSVTGQLTSTDVDHGATAAWSVLNGTGTYGSLSVDQTGQWTYTLNNSAANVQALAQGETATDTFTVKVTDDKGAVTSQTVTVSVNGTNDAAVISGASTGTVQEDVTTSATGQLTSTDVDHGATATWDVVNGTGTYGSLAVDQTGKWTYTLNNSAANVQALTSADHVTDSFTVKVVDDKGAITLQTVTVSVNGSNDAPVVTGVTTGNTQEDTTLSATGQLTATDPDNGSVFTWSVANSGAGTYGSLSVDATGKWTYTLNNAAANVQALAQGETVTDSFNISVNDGHGDTTTQTVTVNILGTNDVPVIAGIATGNAQEDVTTTVTGQLTSTDVDHGATATWDVVGGTGTYGSLSVDQTGKWTYALNNAAANVQALAQGETVQDSFTVKVTDDKGAVTNQIVTVNVAGTNDAAVISGASIGAVQEDVTTSVTGQLTSTDVDHGATATWGIVNGTGTYGTLTVDQTGKWTYTLNNSAANVQALTSADHVTDSFTVKVTDDKGAITTQTVTVNVNGSNDAPVIAGVATGSTQEDVTTSATGQLSATDVDHGSVFTWSVANSGAGTYGTLSVDATGQWTYALNNSAANVQALAQGETVTDTFTVSVNDGHGDTTTQTVTVNILGTNDAPVLSVAAGQDVGAVQEDVTLTTTGQFTATDVDHGATQAWSVVGGGAGTYGTLAVDATGKWTYTLNNSAANVQALTNADHVTDSFTVKVVDDKGAIASHTVTINVAGSNDAPVITGGITGNVQEDTTVTGSGQLTATDVDHGSAFTWTLVSDEFGTYGTLSLDQSGHWTYGLNNGSPAVQALAQGETVQDTFTVAVDDGHGDITTQVLTINIAGKNDAPVVTAAVGADRGNVQEDVTFTADGQLTMSDVDHGAVDTWSVANSGHGTYGSLTIDQTGHWTYTLNNSAANVQALAADEQIVDSFNVLVTDQFGAVGSHVVRVLVNGTNDAPVITAAIGEDQGTVHQDVVLTTSGQLTGTDVDHGAIDTWTIDGDGAGTYGNLTVDQTGQWTYVLNNEAQNVEDIFLGQHVTESFTVRLTDEFGATTTHTVTVEIDGNSQTPIITGVDTGAAQEDVVTTTTGQLSAVDPDNDNDLVWSVAGNGVGTYGTLTVDQTGKWTYTLNNSASNVQSLAQGQHVTETFTVQAQDDNEPTGTHTVTIDIVGTNDAPIIISAIADQSTIDSAPFNFDAGSHFTDIDQGDVLHFTATLANGDPLPSWLSIDPSTGVLSGTPGTGDDGNFSVKVTATDNYGASTSDTFALDVLTSNHPPVANADTAAGTQDQTLTIDVLANDTDPDAGSVLTLTAASVPNGEGTVSIVDGKVVFNPGTAFDHLAQGETQTVVGTYTIQDEHGAPATSTFTVTVTGTNDAPVAVADTGATLQDVPVTIDVLANDTDIDDNAVLTLTDVSVAGGQGSVAIVNNQLVFNPGHDFDHLAAGETQQVVVNYTVTDEFGATSTAIATITVTGTNDAPVAVADTGATLQDVPVTIDVLANDTDVDDNAVLTLTNVSVANGEGSVSIVNNQLVFNPGHDFDHLGAGETQQVVVNYTVTDDQGATSTSTATIIVTGTNDAPVAIADTGATLQGQPVTVDVLANDTDDDDNAVLTLTNVSVGSGEGSVSISNNQLVFNPGHDFDHLAAGETQQVVVTYTVTDDQGATSTSTATITVTGTNDAPVITGTATGATQEDVTLTATGQLTAADADDNATQAWSVVGGGAGTYGSLAVDQNGEWTYTLANGAANVQALASGETVTDTFTVQVDDGQGGLVAQTVTVTVVGTNDAPVITGTASASAQEDTTTTATDQLTATDVDHGATAAWSVVDGVGTYGSLSVDQNGEWTYTLNNSAANVQSLAQGEQVTDAFTVQVDDGQGGVTTQVVTVTIAGSNDAPVVTAEVASGTQNQIVTVDVVADATDVDHGAVLTLSDVSVPNGEGAVSIVDNKLVFNPGHDFDHLGAGETQTVVVDYTVTDEFGATSTSTATITVTGTNDAPVAVADTGATLQGEPVTIDVLANDTDVDDNAVLTLSHVSVSDGEGSVAIVNNELVFNPGHDFDHLAAGQTQDVVVTYTVTDDQGATSTSTATITVTGTNDAPVVSSGDVTGSVQEDTVLQATGQLTATDTDDGATQAWSVVGDNTGTYGSLSVDQTGHWTYTLNNAAANVQALAQGETVQDHFTVQVDDGQGGIATQTVTVNVAGINDAAVISGVATGSVQEDTTLTATGQLTAADVDYGATATWSVIDGAGAYGSLSVDQNGQWTYTLNNSAANVQALAQGETAHDIFTVQVTDDQGAVTSQTVTVNVAGTNDAAVITGTATGTAQEDTTTTVTGQLTATDVDQGATATWSVIDGAGVYGSLAVDQNGEWTYTLNNSAANVQSLAQGETVHDTFTVNVTDDQGAVTAQTVTVNVIGTNDAPVAVADTAATLQDQSVTVDVLANDTDVDDGHVLTLTDVSVGNGEGTATIVNNQLVFNPGHDFDHLGAGETQQVVVTYTATDDQGATSTSTATITVTGTNDAPVAVADTAATLQDVPVTIDVLANDTDVDDNAVLTLTDVSVGAGEGSASIVNNQLVFNPGSDFDHLAAGETQQVVVNYTVTDDQGATSIATATITVTGTNDAPVAVADTGATDVGQTTTVDVLANDTDIDDNAVLTLTDVSVANGQGSVSIVNNQLVFDPGHDFDSLGAGETQDVVVTYTVTDDQGAISTSTATITVTGTNHAPVALDVTATTDQNTPTTFTLNYSDADAGDTDTVTLLADIGGGSSAGSASGDQHNANDAYLSDGTHVHLNSDGTVTFDPGHALDYLAVGETKDETLNYTVTDSHGATSEASITITVEGTNDAPVANADTGATLQDQSVTVDVLANDTDVDDGHVLTLTNASVGDGEGTVSIVDNQLAFNPGTAFDHLAAGQTQDVVVTYTVSDEYGATSTSTATITVTGTNDAPVVSSEIGNQRAVEDIPFSLDVSSHFSDIDDGDVLSYAATLANGDPLPSWLSIDPHTGLLSGTPGHVDTADLSVIVTATDLAGASTTDTFDLNVEGIAQNTPSQIVNTFTLGDQFLPAVTTLENGNVVITWQSLDQDGSGWGVYGQIVGPDATPIGEEFRVNDTTVGNQLASSVTALSNGDFVVTWASNQEGGDNYNIYGQLYNSDGTSIGTEFQINNVQNGLQDQPNVTALAGGGFVVAWDAPDGDADGIFAQLYDASGNAVGGEFQINSTVADNQTNVATSALQNGGFVAVWQSRPDDPNASAPGVGQDGWGGGIYMQQFDASGHAVGAETLVNTAFTAFDQLNPAVATLADGSYVVTWQSLFEDGDFWGVEAQHYAADGTPIGSEFQVNTTIANQQILPAIYGEPDGGFIITWSSYNQDNADGSSGIFGQRFDAEGNKVGDEVQLNDVTLYDQSESAVTYLANNGFAVAYDSYLQDHSGYGIALRFFGPAAAADQAPVVGPAIPDQTGTQDQQFSLNVSGNFTDPDAGDTLHYAAYLANGSPLPSWLSIDPNTGILSGTPDNSEVGTYAIKVVATDSAGKFVSDTFNLVVNNVNDAPVETSVIGDQTVAQGQTLSVDASTHFTDPDLPYGDVLHYTATLADGSPLPAWLSIDSNTGVISGTPGNGDVGAISVKITATDSGNLTSSETLTVTVNNVNDAPVVTLAIADQSATQDQPFSVDISGNFSDPDLAYGDHVTYSATLADGSPLPAWLSFDPNTGVFSGTPDNGDVGSLAVKVTATDNSNASVTDTFNLVVNNVNDAPVETSAIGNQDIDQGQAFSVDASTHFTDADMPYGDVLHYTATLADGSPLPSWLSIDPNSGVISGTPGNGDVGTIAVKITATDNSNASASETLNVTVENVNDAPVVTSEIGDQTESTPFSLDISSHFTDVDLPYGDFLTYSATLGNGDPLPSWITIDPNTGIISGAAGNGDLSGVTITVTATDSFGASVSDNFDLTVHDASTPSQQVNTYTLGDQFLPSITTLNDGNVVVTWQSLNQDGSGWGIYGQIIGPDATPHGTEFLINTTTTGNQLGSSVVKMADGGFVVTWASDGQDGDNYGIYGQRFDSTGHEVGTEFQVNTDTAGLQDQPYIIGLSGGGFVVAFNSPNSDERGVYAQVFDANTQPVGGEFELNTTTLGDQNNVALTALHDGGFVAVWQSQPEDPNDALSGQDGWGGGIYMQRFDASGNPVGSETLVNTEWTAFDQLNPAIATLNDGSYVVTWQSLFQDGDFWGVIGQHYAADGTPIGGEFIVNTTTANQQILPSVAALANGGFVVTWTSYGQDNADGSAGVYSQQFDANGNKVGAEVQVDDVTQYDQSDSVVTGLHNGGYAVAYDSYLQDGSGDGIFVRFFGGVPVGPDHAPIANADTGATDQAHSVTVDVLANDTDQDGDTLTLASVSVQSGQGSVSVVNNELVFNPGHDFDHLAAGETAQVVVHYTVQDPFGAQSIGTATITVTGTNDAPVAVADTGATDQGQPVTIDVLANDTDVDDNAVLTLTDVSVGGGQGTVSIVNNQLVFNPGSDFNHLAAGETQQVAVTYTVTDDQGATSTSTATITVTGTNDAPVANADTGATLQDQPVTVDVLANDTDADDNAVLTLTDVSVGNGEGSVSIVNNQLVFDPGHDFDHLGAGETQQVVVNYTVTDDQGATSTSTATITVTGTNEAPVAVADFGATDQGQPVTIDVLANDTDVDDNAVLTLTDVSVGGGQGTVSIVNNQLVFNPGHDFDALASGQTQDVVVTYTVTDDQGATSTSTATITVTGTNDTPVITSEIGAQTEDTPFSLDISSHFADIDNGDSLTYSAHMANGDPLPDWLTIDSNTGIISSSTDAENSGTFSVVVTATDTYGAAVSDTFDLTVNNGGAPSQVINTFTTGDQMLPSVTTLTTGDVVITWQSLDQDGSGWGIYGQIVSADGTPIGGEFHANSVDVGNQLASSVTALDNGNFVVTWASNENGGDNYNIYGQLYSSNGVAIGSDFQVNSVVNGLQDQPSITALSNGGFVVAWDAPDGDQDGVFAQMYDAAGHSVGNQFQLNSTVTGTQVNVSVSGLQTGGFVAVWQSQPDDINDAGAGQDGWGGGIYMQQFDASGNPVGTETLVNTQWTTFDQLNPSVATLTDGSYVVTWQSLFQDGDFWSVVGQHYAADGTPIGNEFIVNTTTANQQILPSIHSSPNGGFVISWSSYGQDNADGSSGVYAQQFDAAGNKVGGEVQVDDFTSGDQTNSAVTALLNGGFAVAYDSFLQDHSGFGIALRFFGAGETAENTAPTANPDTGATDQDHSVTINVVANDVDPDAGDSITLAAVSVPNGQGSVTIANNMLVFNPGSDFDSLAAGQTAEVVVSYTIRDSHGALSSSTATITVTGTNDAPVVSSEIGSQTETTPFSLDVSSHFSDIDAGDHLTYSATLAGGGALPDWIVIDPSTGVISGTAGSGHSGDFSVDVTATDSLGASVTDTFALTVHSMTDATVVNQVTVNDQYEPSITALANGNYVVTWTSYDGTANNDIDARIFAADGTPIGDQFTVNTVLDNSQFTSSVAALTDGGFVVSWTSQYDDNGTPTFSIEGQRFDSAGHTIGDQFQVNTNTSGDNIESSVTGLSNGGYVVTWAADTNLDGSGFGIFSQMYDAAGNAVGGEFQVNTFTASDQDMPKVSALADGGFVVVWESGVGTGLFDPNSQDQWGGGIFAQIYDASGHAVSGTDIQVNTTWFFDQQDPTVTTLADGSFVVAWQSNQQDGSSWGIEGQHFAADGTKIGDEFQINTTTVNQQIAPSVSALADGGYIVSWTSYGQDNADGSGGIYGQQFDASGHMVGTEFQINTLTNDNQTASVTAGLSDGSFVTAYTDATNDGSGQGVYAHTFSIGNSPFTTGDDTVDFNNVSSSSYEIGTQYTGLGGNDTVTLPFTVSAETASGFDVSHVFTAGSGNDTIVGGALGITVNGGGGSDTIDFGFLNGVKDTLVVGQYTGQDTVNNFEVANDVVDVSAYHLGSFSAVAGLITEVGANAVLNLPNGDTVTLTDTDKDNLHASNFLV